MKRLFERMKNREKKMAVLMDHVEGLDVFEPAERLNLIWNVENGEVTFTSLMNKKKPEVKLKLSKITYVDVATEQEITEKDKAVIGRAVVGTLLAGPLGTMVGGMSGIGSKKKTKDKKVAVIGHENGEVVLLGSGFSIGMDVFFRELKNDVSTRGAKDGVIEL